METSPDCRQSRLVQSGVFRRSAVDERPDHLKTSGRHRPETQKPTVSASYPVKSERQAAHSRVTG